MSFPDLTLTDQLGLQLQRGEIALLRPSSRGRDRWQERSPHEVLCSYSLRAMVFLWILR